MTYRAEALDTLPEIQELAERMLTKDELDEANIITQRLLGKKKEKEWGIAACVVKVGIEPRRPLFYWMSEMEGLPRNTRNCIRYLGDYVDLLVKELSFEILGKGRKRSLTANSRALLNISGVGELAMKLLRYSEFLYTPGKHDFSLPPGREHRFTAKEVVLCSFITANLAKEILSISEGARTAVKEDNLYAIGGGRWGSSTRVEYWGNPINRGSEPPPDP